MHLSQQHKERVIPSMKIMINKFRKVLSEFNNYFYRHKYYLIDVQYLDNNKIKLLVVVQGIKKEIQEFSPEYIVKDDVFLSGFSSCDARTITYLSFCRFIVKDCYEIYIEKQFLKAGETYFQLKNSENDECLPPISAKILYQDYDLLIKLNKKDMINAISTAVQEQTIFDLNSMI